VGTKLKNVCSRIEWDLSWEICVLCYVQSRRSPALINTCQMLDSPHTSAPMLMRGNTSPTTRSPPHRSQSPKSIGKATGTSRQSQRTPCLLINVPTTDRRQQHKCPPDTLVEGDSKRQKVWGVETDSTRTIRLAGQLGADPTHTHTHKRQQKPNRHKNRRHRDSGPYAGRRMDNGAHASRR